MYVIADIEWVDNGNYRQCPTQLSAARVDENWDVRDDFSAFIRPQDESFHIWDHVAFNGGSPQDFLSAYGAYNALSKFEKWLREDDVLCWWRDEPAAMYKLFTRVILKSESQRKTVLLGKYMDEFFGANASMKSAYKLARRMNIVVPDPEHDSENDVIAILRLMRTMKVSQSILTREPIKVERTESKQKVQKTKVRTPVLSAKSSFIFDEDAGVLHKADCDELKKGRYHLKGYNSLAKCVKRGLTPCDCVREGYRQKRHEIAMDKLKSAQFTFVYTERSKVFHHYDCAHLKQVYSPVFGSVRYDTVAQTGRRPCKHCAPDWNRSPQKSIGVSSFRVEGSFCWQTKAFDGEKPIPISRDKKHAIARQRQARREREAGLSDRTLTKQQREDLFVLTQPTNTFFAVKGCQSFHLRNCTKMVKVSYVSGFSSYESACKAGYTPCRLCKPTQKNNAILSIPITSEERGKEKPSKLRSLCWELGYSCDISEKYFSVTTPVGKWRINTSVYPVTVDHINLAMTPNNQSKYHRQHRIFLSMRDAILYIHRHDTSLKEKRGQKEAFGSASVLTATS